MEQASKRLGEQEAIAYREIKNAILLGTLPPGCQLVERDLAAQLNMSHTPIRSALKHLEAQGFLEREKDRRIYVGYLSIGDAIDALYAREALEGMAARLAVRNRTQEQLDRLQEILQNYEVTQKEDTMALFYLGEEMHEIILDACRHEEMATMVRIIKARTAMYHYRTLLLASRAETSTQEHMEILRCLLAGDEDRTEDAARRHVRVIRGLLEKNCLFLGVREPTGLLRRSTLDP